MGLTLLHDMQTQTTTLLGPDYFRIIILRIPLEFDYDLTIMELGLYLEDRIVQIGNIDSI